MVVRIEEVQVPQLVVVRELGRGKQQLLWRDGDPPLAVGVHQCEWQRARAVGPGRRGDRIGSVDRGQDRLDLAADLDRRRLRSLLARLAGLAAGGALRGGCRLVDRVPDAWPGLIDERAPGRGPVLALPRRQVLPGHLRLVAVGGGGEQEPVHDRLRVPAVAGRLGDELPPEEFGDLPDAARHVAEKLRLRATGVGGR